jgi:hypothetical protein
LSLLPSPFSATAHIYMQGVVLCIAFFFQKNQKIPPYGPSQNMKGFPSFFLIDLCAF